MLVAVHQHDPKFFLRYTRIYVDKPTAREETAKARAEAAKAQAEASTFRAQRDEAVNSLQLLLKATRFES